MDSGQAADDHPVPDLAVTRHGDLVGEHAAGADLRIMPDMRARHKQVVIADGGQAPAPFGPGVQGRAFADGVAGADPKRRAFAAVLQVLRNLAHHGAGEHQAVLAEMGVPGHHGMGLQDAALAEDDFRPDHRIGPDRAAFADPCAGLDHGRGMDRGAHPAGW